MAGQSALPSEGTTRVPKFGRVDVGEIAMPRRQCKTDASRTGEHKNKRRHLKRLPFTAT